MEPWENKVIAHKLNSLEDLPDGYAPNIASKWEIIQSGLDGKRKRSKRGWYGGVALLALLLIGGTIYFSKQVDTSQQKQIVQTDNVQEPFKEVAPEMKLKEQILAPTAKKRELIPTPKRQQPKPKKADLPREQMPTVQPTRLPIDTLIKLHIDTVKVSIPIADLKTSKLKKKVFQKDFEGFVTPRDSSHYKTVKGFQIQWRSGRDKEATLDQPRIRLTQNF